MKIVLDTCVLIPALVRDILLQVAYQGGYEPVISDAIDMELREHLPLIMQRHKGRRRNLEEKTEKVLKRIYAVFPHNPVNIPEGYLALAEESQSVRDPGDYHVMAAALYSQSDAIVTFNIKDFQEENFPDGVALYSPDSLLLKILRDDPESVKSSVKAIADRSGRYGRAMTYTDCLMVMSKTMPGVAKELLWAGE